MFYVNQDVVLTFEDGTKVKRAWLAEENGQSILAARSTQTLLCRCTSAGVPMHVVTRGGTHHISSNPKYAHCHALSCPSYIEDRSSTRLSLYTDSAIRRVNHRQHVVVENYSPITQPMAHMSPGALLDYLWELSGLTVCTPKTVTTRTNFLVSQSLYEASQNLTVNGRALKARIPMTNGESESDSEEWIIGQIAKAKRGPYDNRVTLTGERTPFWIGQSVWEGAGLTEHLGDFARPKLQKHLWIIAKVTKTSGSNMQLHTIGIREMNAHFLPCYENSESLAELIDKQERFKVCPRFDSLSSDFPDVLLFKNDAPLPLYFD